MEMEIAAKAAHHEGKSPQGGFFGVKPKISKKV